MPYYCFGCVGRGRGGSVCGGCKSLLLRWGLARARFFEVRLSLAREGGYGEGEKVSARQGGIENKGVTAGLVGAGGWMGVNVSAFVGGA